jgi:hypothetical protein
MGAKTAGFKRGAAVTEMPLRRDSSYPNDYAGDYGDDSGPEFARRTAGSPPLLPWRPDSQDFVGQAGGGRGAAVCWPARRSRRRSGAQLSAARRAFCGAGLGVDPDRGQQPPDARATAQRLRRGRGPQHLPIPLAQRRAELESLPWVEHATVMRLLPNRVRVAIVERTPVAFVRQGSQIGLVDANGVLFDLPGRSYCQRAKTARGTPWKSGTAAAARNAPHYSFPVLTGISAGTRFRRGPRG